MNKFIISGMIVICVVVGIVFIKAKRVNNDHEPLLTPLSSIKPRSTPLVKKILPSDESMSKKKIVPAVLPTKENQKTSYKIMNAVGQTVYSTTLSGNTGSNKVDVNLTNLSTGLYFYTVKVGNNEAVTKKFAVSK